MTPFEETRLRHQLRGPSADLVIDFDRVAPTTRARRAGDSWLRRFAESYGAALCVGVITIASALFPGGRSHPDEGGLDGPAPTVAVAPQPLAAAMLERVRSLEPGVGSDYAGQDHWLPRISTPGPAVAARFRFTPDATAETGWVVVRLQTPAPTSLDALSCTGNLSSHPGGRTTTCDRGVLSDGTVLREFATELEQPDGSMLVEHHVEAILPNEVLVSTTSTNTADGAYGRGLVEDLDVGGEPALSGQDLRWIVLWDGWGARLPERYAVQGSQLAPFDESPQSW